MFPWSPCIIFAPLLFYMYERWRSVCTLFSTITVSCETIVLLLGMINIIILLEGTRRRHLRQPSSPKPIENLPSVLIIVPTCKENVTIIQQTVHAVLAIDYPSDKLTIVITDDGNDHELETFVHSCHCSHLHYKTRGLIKGHAKAGNINDTLFTKCIENGKPYYYYEGDFVLILDCDMVPKPDILKTMIPMMYDEKGELYGFVQSPQSFHNIKGFDFLGQNYYFFYRVVLKAWDGFDLGVPCCGTNVLFDRKALEQIGGFIYGSLTEDFKTSLKLHSLGIKTRYCDRELATGYAPLTLVDFFNQRSRWAMGGLQIIFSNSIQDIYNLPVVYKWVYGFSGLSPFLSVFLFILMIAPLMTAGDNNCNMKEVIYIYSLAPYAISYTLMLLYLHIDVGLSVFITSIQETIFMIPMMLWIIFVFCAKSMGITRFSWKITPKEHITSQYGSTMLWLSPYLIYIAAGIYTVSTVTDKFINTFWLVFMMFQLIPVPLYVLQSFYKR